MKKIATPLLTTLLILLIGYLLLCLLLYFQQEKLIFFPRKLPKDYVFRFDEAFEERFIQAPDGVMLHGLLFKAGTTRSHSQGLVFFLHGNAGALDQWGELADVYTRLNYDVFMLDYRGYGKSEGEINSQEQLYSDVMTAYQHMAAEYGEQDIVVVGFSIGTGPAAMLAARQQPQKLLLLAPYYSLVDIMQQRFAFVPTFLLKYKFRTHAFLDKTTAPVYLFHGTEDEVIPYGSSVKLQQHLKPGDRFFSLGGLGHNGIHDHPAYRQTLSSILLTDTPPQEETPAPEPVPAR